jgi:AcrR family transcriptional regulator
MPRATDRADEPAPAGSPATRQRILLAAHDTMRRFGIRRTTMEDVARRANMSRAAVYRYYADKPTLVDAVLLHNGHLVREELTKRLRGATTFADKCVLAAQFGQRMPRDGLLLALNETEPETLALLLTTGAAPFLERATRFWLPHVTEAQQHGEVRADLDPRATAEWVARSIYALSVIPTVTFDRRDPEALERFVRTYIAGGLAGSAPNEPTARARQARRAPAAVKTAGRARRPSGAR